MDDARQIDEVLARYMRATDNRDGAAQAGMFAPHGVIQIWSRTESGGYETAAPEFGAEHIELAVTTMLPPRPAGGFSHHVTMDHVVTIDGDSAHLSAQFLVFEVRRAPEPPLQPAESGYYEMDLVRIDGEWKILRSDVKMDLPPS